MIQLEISLLIIALASLGLALGFKWGRDSVNSISEEEKEKAFEDAKAEYIEWFHKRFSVKGEQLAEAYNKAAFNEIKRLEKENKELRKQIKKFGGKNESSDSN